jgi:hypothetical protein
LFPNLPSARKGEKENANFIRTFRENTRKLRKLPEKDLVKIIKLALEKTDKTYVNLSRLRYSMLDDKIRTLAMENKYLERPFAYEFYHALRELIEVKAVELGRRVVQAEVDKRYQNYFRNGKIPDFIIHVPGQIEPNLAVIEFKLATNVDGLSSDLEKLAAFKRFPLKYAYGIEVIIGKADDLTLAINLINKLTHVRGEKIVIVTFNTDSWKAKDFTIEYMPSNGFT